MMVNCPKCGFSQPQDQYCAKCGVDMIAYRPRAKPFLTRLVSNTTFQISALAFLTLAGGLYVREANRASLARTISETPIAREAEEQEAELSAAQANEEHESKLKLQQTVSASESAPAPTPPPAAPAQAKESSFVASSATVADAAPPTAPAAAAPPTNPRTGVVATAATNIRVTFIEAQRGLLNGMLRNARQSATDGTITYGVVADYEKRVKPGRDWRQLDEPNEQAIRLNQSNPIFKGTRDQTLGQDLGFTLKVLPVSQDREGTHLQVIDATRVLRDGQGGAETFPFPLPDNFALTPGSALIVTGVLPHRPPFEGEERLYRNVNVLKPLVSGPAFRGGATDVAIVIEAR